MQALINDLLSLLARGQLGARSRCAWRALERALANLGNRHRGVRRRVDGRPAAMVRATTPSSMQLLQNLVGNA